VILGGDDLIGEVTFSGEIDVGEFVVVVYGAFHSGLVASDSAGLHLVCGDFNKILFIIIYQLPALEHQKTLQQYRTDRRNNMQRLSML